MGGCRKGQIAIEKSRACIKIQHGKNINKQKTGRVAAYNLPLPAGGIRRPHALRFAPGVREWLVVTRHDRRFDRKHMIKNRRIPRDKTIIPDSEISDGTPPVCADSEARPERFLPKRKFFSDRADKNLYFPILSFGRGDSDASRRFVTWGIEIYNQIMRLSILRVKNYRATQKTGRSRRVTWGSRRAAFAALTRVLISGGRGCGSPWSLCDIIRPEW